MVRTARSSLWVVVTLATQTTVPLLRSPDLMLRQGTAGTKNVASNSESAICYDRTKELHATALKTKEVEWLVNQYPHIRLASLQVTTTVMNKSAQSKKIRKRSYPLYKHTVVPQRHKGDKKLQTNPT
ncbi:hypothetical protein BCV69DRAFT_285004 [Microstroma glucosiphilum]|uniref:Secreted protein n=1 Tax=Pseudomicrostroma glucosiphilum TaxID=1684307 RepID=A0A316TYM7_9BASI|nr:hypothetical protein BCV69DRAFT_285004 [Pseudomicrostroma glucosiphilum]PWN18376.1 hypothetical protein BCV69DRAFT_285004 [Pseudomicrostroma glucosiphilum]